MNTELSDDIDSVKRAFEPIKRLMNSVREECLLELLTLGLEDGKHFEVVSMLFNNKETFASSHEYTKLDSLSSNALELIKLELLLETKLWADRVGMSIDVLKISTHLIQKEINKLTSENNQLVEK